MNIAMISVYFLPSTVGGVELHIYHLSKALQQLGHNVVVFQPSLVDREAGQVNMVEDFLDGIPIRRLEVPSQLGQLDRFLDGVRTDTRLGYLAGFARKSSYIWYAQVLADKLGPLMSQFDVIHQHDFSSSWRLTRLLSRRKPCVLTNHTGEFLFIRRSKWLRHLVRPALSHYKAIIGPSQELCDVGYPDDRVVYIPNGVQLDRFEPSTEPRRSHLRERYGLEQDEFVILCPRRWAPTKGVKYLVEALPTLRQLICTGARFRVLMVGSDYSEYPAYRREIMDRIQELGLQKEVKLCGNASLAQMSDFYAVSDVVVLPSLMEATSLAGLEAMACGLPIVATSVGGLPEIIVDGVTGLLVPPSQPVPLAEALAKLCLNRALGDSMGACGRKIAMERFSWDSIARQTVAVYERVLRDGTELVARSVAM